MTTVFAAYLKSTRHYPDGEPSEDSQHLIDADTDEAVLRDRVNAYYAQPNVMRGYRGTKLVVPPGAMESNEFYGDGGGCGYRAHISIQLAPTLILS